VGSRVNGPYTSVMWKSCVYIAVFASVIFNLEVIKVSTEQSRPGKKTWLLYPYPQRKEQEDLHHLVYRRKGYHLPSIFEDRVLDHLRVCFHLVSSLLVCTYSGLSMTISTKCRPCTNKIRRREWDRERISQSSQIRFLKVIYSRWNVYYSRSSRGYFPTHCKSFIAPYLSADPCYE
jgi:hypothetical protein